MTPPHASLVSADIQFWNQNKSMEGLSQRTIVINFFCSLVIFLYLLDNETSWMIIISAGVSVLIDFWKIGKAMHITVRGRTSVEGYVTEKGSITVEGLGTVEGIITVEGSGIGTCANVCGREGVDGRMISCHRGLI